MTIGDGIAFGTFWVCAAASWIAWLRLRAPRHEHMWKETGRYDWVNPAGKKVGEHVICACEECGESRSFNV